MIRCSLPEKSLNKCFETGFGALLVSVTETKLIRCINVLQYIWKDALVIFSQKQKVLPSLQKKIVSKRIDGYRGKLENNRRKRRINFTYCGKIQLLISLLLYSSAVTIVTP